MSGDFEFYVLSDEALEYLEGTTAKAVGRLKDTPKAQQVPLVDPGPQVPEDDRVADAPE